MKRFLLALLTLACAHVSADVHPIHNEGFYLGGIVGADFLHLDHKPVRLEPEVGFVLGASAGYQFCSSFALEGELAYRRQNAPQLHVGSLTLNMDGLVELTTVMVNILYQWQCAQFCTPWVGMTTPYVGFGLGYAHFHELAANDFINFRGKNDSLTCQGIIGLNWAINCCMDLGLEYRCVAHHKNTYNQSVNLVLKQFF
jgi:opacity protein-like surface antigen